MEGFIGYNKENIEALRGTVERAYAQVVAAIPGIIRTGVIIPISECWYTQEGYNYFRAFATAVASTSILMHDCYQAFVDDIKNAGEAWADTTGNERPVLGVIETAPMTMSVDEIQATDANGSAVIDVERAKSIAAGLSQVQADILAKVQEANGVLDAETAFIGAGQAQAVQELFAKVAEIIGKIFNFLTEGTGETEGQSLFDAINLAAEKQAEQAGNVVNAYSANGSGSAE